MAYTAPATKAAGDPTLAADWNNYVRDNFVALRALLPDPTTSTWPLVATSTTGASFSQLDTGGIRDGAVTTEKLAVTARAPIGVIQMYAGVTAPSGWLFCRGQEISRSEYPDLFTTIGTNYGAGDGSTTFRVPNLQERFAVGVATSVGTAYTLGATGGTGTISVNHNHGLGSHAHTLAHTHTVSADVGSILMSESGNTIGANFTSVASGTTKSVASTGHAHDAGFGNLTTSTSSTASVGMATGTTATGGSVSQSILPPYTVVNYIIFAGK